MKRRVLGGGEATKSQTGVPGREVGPVQGNGGSGGGTTVRLLAWGWCVEMPWVLFTGRHPSLCDPEPCGGDCSPQPSLPNAEGLEGPASTCMGASS